MNAAELSGLHVPMGPQLGAASGLSALCLSTAVRNTKVSELMGSDISPGQLYALQPPNCA